MLRLSSRFSSRLGAPRFFSTSPGGPEIVVHGGAWAIPEQLTDASVAGCEAAAQAGWEVLQRGGTAVESVEAATRVLEDDPAFDAGNGAVLNELGEVELDAIIMDGIGLECGAVAAIAEYTSAKAVNQAGRGGGEEVAASAKCSSAKAATAARRCRMAGWARPRRASSPTAAQSGARCGHFAQ